MFPKQSVRLNFPAQFLHYLRCYLSDAGVQTQTITVSDPQRRIKPCLIYKMVTYQETQHCFLLDDEEKIQVFSRLLGETAVFGIRKRKPKIGTEFATSERDAGNVLSKVELFLSMSYLKIRVHAFKYLVGDETNNFHLLAQLSDSQPPSQSRMEAPPTLRINSKFDFRNSVYSVVREEDDGKILTVCVWGEQKGEELRFENAGEVLELVRRKRR
mmetsp:Transcript_16997/g.24214  ORF Transcript_16997/g.24214 Transcript_16997/m.24214 type:complete len:214 (+) Transcript_16997:733-1374(+)